MGHSPQARLRISRSWTPERRRQQAALMRGKRRTLEQRRKMRQAWTPERRAEQARRLISVRLSGQALRQMALQRESRKRRGRALSRAWTPERRLEQAQRAKKIPLEAKMRGAQKLIGRPIQWEALQKVQAWWTPERRRMAAACTHANLRSKDGGKKAVQAGG